MDLRKPTFSLFFFFLSDGEAWELKDRTPNHLGVIMNCVTRDVMIKMI